MFEKIGRLADGMASSISTSRRGFLGRVGKTAMGAAGMMSAVMLLRGTAQAHEHKCWECVYTCPGGGPKLIIGEKKCKQTYEGCTLKSENKVGCGP